MWDILVRKKGLSIHTKVDKVRTLYIYWPLDMSHSTYGKTVREVPGRNLHAGYVPPKERLGPTTAKITGQHGLNWERPEFKGGLKYPGGYTGAILRPADLPTSWMNP